MSGRFRVGDVALLYMRLAERPRPEKEFYRVILRGYNEPPHIQPGWRASWLYEYSRGEHATIFGVSLLCLHSAIWTFTGYILKPSEKT